MGMAQGGSIFDKLLEVVDTYACTEGRIEHTFTLDVVKNGAYIIICDPPGILENALNDPNVSQFGLLNMSFFEINGVNHDTVRAINTMSIRPQLASSGYYDWWGGKGTLNGNQLDYQLIIDREGYTKGYTYYLCRVKG